MQGRPLRALACLVAASVGRARRWQPVRSPQQPIRTRSSRSSQPDGRSFKARIWGDEYIHGYEALNGHTVVLDGRTKRSGSYARAWGRVGT